ncbi:DUF4402 domain-containing protein [Sphingomonas ginkgonis]|uniref:DUF4402 domain-containing protein n=1 Tax=Sphingomonas ginkgonis TaxID=2315330 RepID=A0A3R9YGR1_9SPHN|nr:DUF4402 domain-containing protein [Sphingomonas ginkgonis]RST29551.1 DUF4402 domain-containing protein [Sphingomonas ginkgonis]
MGSWRQRVCCWPAAAVLLLAGVPAYAATISVSATASVVKPLVLTRKSDLNFGTIVLPQVAAASSVSISQAGVVSCGAGLSCAGAPAAATLNVQGTNKMVVLISTAASQLVNQSDGSRISFTPSAPASVTLTSSGVPGNDFNVGGRIDLPATTTGGLYSGTIQVTVDYQ